LEPRAGFEPATLALPTAQNELETSFWEDFECFLLENYTNKTAKERYKYALKFHQCLLRNDMSPLKLLSASKKAKAMKALSSLSKYLGIYERFRTLVRNYGLKWNDRSTDDLIIARLIRNQDPNKLYGWIVRVKQTFPQFRAFMDFAVSVGLRFGETLHAYNLIIELDRKGELNRYYNAENEILEHFRFKNLFLRRTKKAFISFVSREMVETVARTQNTLTYDTITKRLKRRGFKMRFSDLRELWASFMVKHLAQPEIDFLQGRISASVFMLNYFNPTWISDLKERTLKGVEELLNVLS